jgi:integrase
MLPDPGKRTVADLLNAWLEMAEATLKPRTLQSYAEIADRYIRPTLGPLRLDKLTPQAVQHLILTPQKEGKARTAPKIYQTLRRACAVAVLWGWLPHNPCDRVFRPTYRPERRDVWTQDELRRFLDGAKDHPIFPLYLLLLAGGLRLDEALALQ